MKQYHLYVFTQDACPPCHRLHDYVDSKLTDDEKAELDFVPLKTPEGKRTALAEELACVGEATLRLGRADLQHIGDGGAGDAEETAGGGDGVQSRGGCGEATDPSHL